MGDLRITGIYCRSRAKPQRSLKVEHTRETTFHLPVTLWWEVMFNWVAVGVCLCWGVIGGLGIWVALFGGI